MNVFAYRDDLAVWWCYARRPRGLSVYLEEEFRLTATAPAGQGLGGSLSRREVEAVRAGAVASVSDLNQHRVATIVRAVGPVYIGVTHESQPGETRVSATPATVKQLLAT